MPDYIRFSERMGYSEPRKMLGKEDMPDYLKVRIWNVISKYLFYTTYDTDKQQNMARMCDMLWDSFFKLRTDKFEYNLYDKIELVTKGYYNLQGIVIYDFIDYLVFISRKFTSGIITKHEFNILFKEELVPYRFINHLLVPITNEEEIAELEKVRRSSDKFGLNGVSDHINQALIHFSNRENPDYRNCIKECISAIESICRIIVDDKSKTLGKALNKLKKDANFNNALISGFEKIYGFTNGDSGIRHALDTKDGVQEEDARYFLISSSAFINYLIVKANNQGLIF